MKVTFYCYGLKDKEGNEWSAVTNEGSDIVQVYGLNIPSGEYFESDAYHLRSFALRNDLKYYSAERTIEF